jgi:hypothetical protein
MSNVVITTHLSNAVITTRIAPRDAVKVKAAQIRELQRTVRRTSAAWHSLRADAPEEQESAARDTFYRASRDYLNELENYFDMCEQARR